MLSVEGLMSSVKHMSVEVKYPLFAFLIFPHSSQDSFNPADKNIHREGLGLIIVTAQLESSYLVFTVAACGKDDKRYLRQPVPDVFDQLIAVQSDALQLHEHSIPMSGRQYIQTCLAVTDTLRFVAAAVEIVAQHGGKADVSVYDEDLCHGVSYFCGLGIRLACPMAPVGHTSRQR